MTRNARTPRPARSAALLIALAGALVLPLATVSADIGSPPDGSGRNVFLTSDAPSVTAHEEGGTVSICVETASELGCGETTTFSTTAGFITGLTSTITVSEPSGAMRDVAVAFSLTFASAIVPSSEVIDGSDETCSVTWTVKERTVAVAGTLTYDGVPYPVGAESTSKIRTLKEKVRC
jgi:hypothetical protein